MKHNWISLLAEDVNFIVYQKGSKGHLRYVKAMLSPSFICTFIYRLSHVLHRLHIPLLPRLLWWINLIVFTVDIDQRAKLYGGLYLPHPMTICIGQHVRLQGCAKIMQSVTIGGNLGKQKQQSGITYYQPTLQGHMFIGIGSIIVGPVFITGNVFIAAHQIISSDIDQDGHYFQQQCSPLKPGHLKELGVKDVVASN